MLNLVAAIVDHAATRITLTLFGLGVTVIFGAFAVILLISNAMPGESPSGFFVGLGGCLGVLGWWARLFVRARTLARSPFLRTAILVCLAAGILATLAGTSMFPRDTPGHVVLWLMAGAGSLLLIGSLGATRTGPGPSSTAPPGSGSE